MKKLSINGEIMELPSEVTTVKQLLAHFKLDQKVVIVEKNKEILQKDSHEMEHVNDGDQIELVHFVGGG
ncbi:MULTISPECIES: sulfur carrier protein ThiS [Bacillus]|uniref:sulfur carrier protein ThiS n=1 Tax=Bacillus TaxID=1386 RepID=UPI000BB748CE|nr:MULTISPECIES: sulfur carrier protein ThiS [Bacillus]